MEHREFGRNSFGSIANMDVSTDRFVHRMPSMVDWASSGQRAAAACSAPLPLIDGQDVDNLALGIAIFGFGAWEDIAKLSGSNSVRVHRSIVSRSPHAPTIHGCIRMPMEGSISLDMLPSDCILSANSIFSGA
jgi:hypothetical protein